MTFEQILTLEAILQTGSFKSAAEKMYKSQPSISMAIKKLEEEYGILIFSRDEYRPKLTHDGLIFYEKAKKVLSSMRELEELGKMLGRGEEAELKISIDAISPLPLILKFLRKFFDRHPKTRLVIRFEVLNGTLERLEEDEVDLAITSILDEKKQFETMSLTEVTLVPVMHKDLYNRLLKSFKVKTLTDEILRTETQVILADSARRLPKIDSGVLPEGKSITLTELSFKKEMITQGLGWGGLPYESIINELKNKTLIPIKTNNIHERRAKIHVLRKKGRAMGPVMKELWESFREDF